MRRMVGVAVLAVGLAACGQNPQSVADKVGCIVYKSKPQASQGVETEGTCLLEGKEVVIATFKENGLRDIYVLGESVYGPTFVVTDKAAVGSKDPATVAKIRARIQ